MKIKIKSVTPGYWYNIGEIYEISSDYLNNLIIYSNHVKTIFNYQEYYIRFDDFVFLNEDREKKLNRILNEI
jgi:hypothetical protein